MPTPFSDIKKEFEEKFNKPISDEVHRHLSSPTSHRVFYDNTEILAFFKSKWEKRDEELREVIENMKHKSIKDQFGYDPIDNPIFSREKEHN